MEYNTGAKTRQENLRSLNDKQTCLINVDENILSNILAKEKKSLAIYKNDTIS